MARNLQNRLVQFDVDMRRIEAMRLFYEADPEAWKANHWRARGVPSSSAAIRHLWLASLRYVRANRIQLQLHKQLARLDPARGERSDAVQA